MAEEERLNVELTEARTIIARQALQIHRLEKQADESSAVTALHELLLLSEVVGEIVGEAPYRSLLTAIIEAAKHLFHAAGASISLLDHETNELVFAAAAESHLIGMRFPAHQGISGWVVMTGEPIAVGDVRRDPRFARDFAASTGYVPQSIMAVPLIVKEDIEGVLSVLDKASAASFGLDDLELLGIFARPAAIAVEQARMAGSIGEMLVRELGRLAAEHGELEVENATEAALAGGNVVGADTLTLARLVHTISRRSDRTREAAIEILSALEKLAR